MDKKKIFQLLVDTYREVEREKLRYSDNPPDLEYFINSLEDKIENLL